MDGPLAADRIVDAWEELAPETVRTAPPLEVRHLRALPTPRMFARSVRDGLLRALHLEGAQRRAQRLADRDLLDLKFPPFDLQEVQRIHAALVASRGVFSDVRITQVGPRILHLTRR